MDKKQYIISVKNSIWGFALGDALGVPFEFFSPDELQDLDITHLNKNKYFSKSHPSVPLGTWSDDTSQLLILLESLINNNGLDVHDFSQKLIKWKNTGYMSIDGYTFDIGVQTYQALKKIENNQVKNWFNNISEFDNGNGSLMRVLALSLYSKSTNVRLILDAHNQSAVTHPHIRSQICCAIYAVWARNILKGMSVETAWFESIDTIFNFYKMYLPIALNELDLVLSFDEKSCHGTGYVVDTLQTVKNILFNNYNYQSVVSVAIKTGNDTDTTAALSGGIAAIAYGLNTVPDYWWQQLRGKIIIDRVIHKFYRSI